MQECARWEMQSELTPWFLFSIKYIDVVALSCLGFYIDLEFGSLIVLLASIQVGAATMVPLDIGRRTHTPEQI